MPRNTRQEPAEFRDNHNDDNHVHDDDPRDRNIGLIEFKLTFDRPGVYEFTMEELTKSGNGWETDSRVYPVIVTVTDDDEGNLTANVEYPEGTPRFRNVYRPKPVEVVITARKRAIGARLPCERFEFGLFNEHGRLVAKTKNKCSSPVPADEPEPDDDDYGEPQ